MRQAYDTDLTDQEWETIMPKPFKLGSSATVSKRGCDLNLIHSLSSNGKTILIELVPELLPTSRG